MRRGWKRIAWVAGLIVAALIAYAAWIAVMGPRIRQAHALTLLQQDHRPTQGRNAFPALWLAGYDVPPERIDAVYAQDRQRMPAWLAQVKAGTWDPSNAQGVLAPGYPPLPPLATDDRSLLCAWRDADCLGTVRAHVAAVQTVLAKQAMRLRHAEALDAYDILWDDMPADMAAPIPSYAGWNELLLTKAALDFVQDRREQGIARICTSAATARRLHAHSNTLIGTMVVGAWLQADARLFVRMLAELPSDQTLPASCNTAFAPVVLADVDLCPSMQREFRQMHDSLVGELDRTPEQRKQLSLDGLQRMNAPTMAWSCTASVQRQLLADRLDLPAMPPARPALIDRLTNPLGSKLLSIAPPDYRVYLYRQQDVAASLRLVATILWLRQTRGDGRPLATRFAQRPAWMHVAADRKLSWSPDGRHLHMDNHNPQPAWSVDWPLPARL